MRHAISGILPVLFVVTCGCGSGGSGTGGSPVPAFDSSAEVLSVDARLNQISVPKDRDEKKLRDVANQMNSIDISRCPQDYQAAFVQLSSAVGEFFDYCIETGSWEFQVASGLESFLRGFSGDPFGGIQQDRARSREIRAKLREAIANYQRTLAKFKRNQQESQTQQVPGIEGDANALNARGLKAYDDGNYDEAVRYLRRAAEMGHAKAQNHLAVCYKLGRGVPRNDSSAVKWLHQAAEQGEADAQYNLGIVYMEGTGVAKNESTAIEWYKKAALQGKVSAQFNLGVFYESGRGVRQDVREAIRWYRMAANQGDAQAKARLRELGAS